MYLKFCTLLTLLVFSLTTSHAVEPPTPVTVETETTKQKPRTRESSIGMLWGFLIAPPVFVFPPTLFLIQAILKKDEVNPDKRPALPEPEKPWNLDFRQFVGWNFDNHRKPSNLLHTEVNYITKRWGLSADYFQFLRPGQNQDIFRASPRIYFPFGMLLMGVAPEFRQYFGRRNNEAVGLSFPVELTPGPIPELSIRWQPSYLRVLGNRSAFEFLYAMEYQLNHKMSLAFVGQRRTQPKPDPYARWMYGLSVTYRM